MCDLSCLSLPCLLVTLFVISTRTPPKLSNEKAYDTRESFVEAVVKGERPKVSVFIVSFF